MKSIQNQSTSHHQPDTNMMQAKDNKKLLARTASAMSLQHSQSMDSIADASTSSLGSAENAKVKAFLQEFAAADENDIPTLTALAGQFVQNNVGSPEVINSTLNFLNGQGLILRGQELTERANVTDSKLELANNISAYIATATEQHADPLAGMNKISVSPVFTAHPTNLSKPEAAQVTHNMSDFSLASYSDKTDSLKASLGNRSAKPSVLQEAQGNHTAIRNVMKSAHRVHKSLNAVLQSHSLGSQTTPMIEVGNWVGGDRDGNPNVDARTMKQITTEHAQVAISEYARKLSPSKLIHLKPRGQENLRQLMEKAGQGAKANEVLSRLEATSASIGGDISEGAIPYASAENLIADLQSINLDSLPQSEKSSAQSKLDNLIMDVKTSGFHGTTTDIRQNSAVNEQTVSTLLRLTGIESNYSKLNEGGKQYLLNTLLNSSNMSLVDQGDDVSSEFKQEIGLINSYSEIQEKLGPKALGNCITANTETVSDLMEVMVLLRHAGVAGPNHLNMNIVGLIETVDDLKNAPKIMDGLLSVPWYSKVMSQSGKPQMVMVGYSDSSRLDGSLSSNWEVYNATHTMMDIAKKHHIELKFFHGRGGTESRGAGQNYAQEIRVHDSRSLENGFRQTEQGEEVGDKFGNIDLATVNISTMLGSTLGKISMGPDSDYQAGKLVMQPLAEVARESYHNLVSDKAMPRFYQSSTPIEFVGKSNAGSRPASRKASADGSLDLSKLRAIPWAACWMQSRAMVPAFFGTGTAINKWTNTGDSKVDQQRMGELKQLYKSWPFFQNFVDRTELALAKSDMEVFKSYVSSDQKSEAIASKIVDEHKLTSDSINRIKGQSTLLENRPDEREILEVKRPVLNRSNAMQAALLKEAQNGGSFAAERLADSIVISMQAVANSLGRFG